MDEYGTTAAEASAAIRYKYGDMPAGPESFDGFLRLAWLVGERYGLLEGQKMSEQAFREVTAELDAKLARL